MQNTRLSKVSFRPFLTTFRRFFEKNANPFSLVKSFGITCDVSQHSSPSGFCTASSST